MSKSMGQLLYEADRSCALGLGLFGATHDETRAKYEAAAQAWAAYSKAWPAAHSWCNLPACGCADGYCHNWVRNWASDRP